VSTDRPGEFAAFVRAVDGSGFSAAARQLGLTPSAVSKVVSRLEARLGVRLLNRTTRRLSLTAEGEQFYQRAQRILAEIEEAEREVASARAAPRGLLRMHTGTNMGMHQLPPVLPEFSRRYPQIEIELTISDRLVDLVEVGADLALRTGKPARAGDTQWVARTICDLERVICAAPSYLRKHGVPRVPGDLQRHECLRLLEQPHLALWPFRTPDGVRTLEVRGRYAANHIEALLQMALAGMGILRSANVVAGKYLASGELVPLLTDTHHAEPVPLYVLMPPGKHRLPKVTAMVDFLFEKFSTPPWRQATAAVRRSRPVKKRR
jgi:DNA-binding transcriptional LysR family regulator